MIELLDLHDVDVQHSEFIESAQFCHIRQQGSK